MSTILNIVVPCYNEQEVLRETAKGLYIKMKDLMDHKIISKDSKITFVNDGSSDGTWEIICELHNKDQIYSGINLSKNRGHQNALLAGLETVKDKSDAVITIDADLQDDIEAIDDMVKKYHEGNDIVYGVRSSRATDSFFKRFSAESYYKVMNFFGAEILYNHADYRLMSRKAINGLLEFEEVNLFLRGVIPLIGYPSDIVYYERNQRLLGESKYPLKKMLEFAWEGITSFSIKPIRMITMIGLMTFSLSIVMLVYIFIRYFSGETIVGWASVTVSLWAIGGLILLSLGIVGEYIGKIYLEVKKRPKYFVTSYLNDEGIDGK